MAKPNLYYVDPSIRECAIALISEAIGSINRILQDDSLVSYWMARDKALEAVANQWVAKYGRECADAAVKGLYCLAPDEVIEADTKRILRDDRIAQCRRHLTELDPTRDTKLNRFWITLTGYRLYVLAMFVAAATLAVGGVGEAQAAPGASQGREWRALALCGVSRPGPARERACRQFNSAERAGFRGYDAPAGTPRSWELPRAWEIEP